MAGAFVWNFFVPPPSGDLPKLVEYWFYVGNHAVNHHPDFLATHLHKNLDPNPKFVYVNFGIFKTDGFISGRDRTEDMRRVMMEARKIKEDAKGLMGGFVEVAVTTGKSPYPYERPSTARFIVSNFTVPDDVSSEDFEANWRDWTGVSLLEKEASPDMGYVYSALYRRVTPHGPYRYVVRSEFAGLHDKHEAGFGLVGKLRDYFGSEALTSKKIEADATMCSVVIDMQKY